MLAASLRRFFVISTELLRCAVMLGVYVILVTLGGSRGALQWYKFLKVYESANQGQTKNCSLFQQLSCAVFVFCA